MKPHFLAEPRTEDSVSKMFSIVFAFRFPELRVVTKDCIFLTVNSDSGQSPKSGKMCRLK